MAQENNRQFLNGIFADKKNGNYGEYIDLHIPEMKRFLDSLQSLPLNSKGGLRLRITPQQTDPTRMSIYLNDWEPTQQAGQPLPQRTPSPSQSKPATGQKPAPAPSSGDDLPF